MFVGDASAGVSWVSPLPSFCPQRGSCLTSLSSSPVTLLLDFPPRQRIWVALYQERAHGVGNGLMEDAFLAKASEPLPSIGLGLMLSSCALRRSRRRPKPPPEGWK